MALIPVRAEALSKALVLGVPTGEQWSAYWGRTPREKYDAIFESASVTFIGIFGSYFLSFVIGSPLATLSGTIAFFWILLGPEFKAYQRNWELHGGRQLIDIYYDEYENEDDVFLGIDIDKRGLYGAYYLSSVLHVAVVNNADNAASEEYPLSEFDDYTMDNDEEEQLTGIPYKLRLRIEDKNGRMLQIHARMSEEYLDIKEGMPVASILLSTNPNFNQLAALTDIWIPDVDAWVGDYPYLNKEVFRRLIGRKKIRRLLQKERWLDKSNVDHLYEENEDEYEDYL